MSRAFLLRNICDFELPVAFLAILALLLTVSVPRASGNELVRSDFAFATRRDSTTPDLDVLQDIFTADGSSGNGGSAPPSGCALNLVQFAVSGNFVAFLSGIVGDIGSHSDCVDMFRYDWCGLYVVFVCETNGSVIKKIPQNASKCFLGIGPAIGICINPESVCSTRALEEQLWNISTASGFGGFLQLAYGSPGGLCFPADEIAKSCAGSDKIYPALTAKCERDAKKLQNDTVAIALVASYGAFAFLVVLASVVLYFRSSPPSSEPSSKCVSSEIPVVAPAPLAASENSALLLGIVRSDDALKITQTYDAGSLQNGTIVLPQPPSSASVSTRSVKPSNRLCWRVVQCFDLARALKQLGSASTRSFNGVDTDFMDGLRVVSMLIILYGHSLFVPSELNGFYNNARVGNFLSSFASILVYQAECAVDVFFFLSGFLLLHTNQDREATATAAKPAAATEIVGELLSYHGRSQVEGSQGALMSSSPSVSVPSITARMCGILRETGHAVLHRYLRIAPVTMSTLVLAAWVLVYIPHGPSAMLMRESSEFASCRNGGASSLWHQALFITNWNPEWDKCLSWFWFLSCDFQLFLIGWLAIIVHRFTHPGFFVLATGCVIAGVSLSAYHQALLSREAYVAAVNRMAPFWMGTLAAAIVRLPRVRSLFQRRVVRTLSYSAIIILLGMSSYFAWAINAPHFSKTAPQRSSAYITRAQVVIAAGWGGACFILTLCWGTGASHGGWMKQFMSCRLFRILGKLTFTCYALHPIVISCVAASQEAALTFSPATFPHFVSANAVWSYAGAAVMHVFLEYPFLQLSRLLIGPRPSPSPRPG